MYLMIGLSTPKKTKIGASVIKLVEGTNFSHTFLSWRDNNIDRRKIYESVGAGGTRKIGARVFHTKAKIVEAYYIKVSEAGLIALEQYVTDWAGVEYGYKNALGLGIKRVVFRLTGWVITNPYVDGTKSMPCIEAALYVLKDVLGQDIPGNIEDYGLVEYRELIKKIGRPLSEKMIEKLNSSPYAPQLPHGATEELVTRP